MNCCFSLKTPDFTHMRIPAPARSNSGTAFFLIQLHHYTFESGFDYFSNLVLFFVNAFLDYFFPFCRKTSYRKSFFHSIGSLLQEDSLTSWRMWKTILRFLSFFFPLKKKKSTLHLQHIQGDLNWFCKKKDKFSTCPTWKQSLSAQIYLDTK